MAAPPPERHLLRARDLADARYAEALTVADMARASGQPWRPSAESSRTFGGDAHRYLLTRRLERAALLLRTTDRRVVDVCFLVGLGSVGSFTTSFRRMFGMTPMQYRERFPPASSRAVVPSCIVRFYGRPQNRTFREDPAPSRPVG